MDVANLSVSEPALAAQAGLNLQADDFVLFGVPRQFAQERAELDARWKQLQREAHPDKFAAQGAAAQRIAMQWSVRINEAYQRLKDPLRRAAYLCELGGVPVQAHTNTAMPAAFLQQQMEWRDSLEEAATRQALEQLQQEVETERARVTMACAQAIDGAHDLHQAVALVRTRMFIDKFLNDLDLRLDQLD